MGKYAEMNYLFFFFKVEEQLYYSVKEWQVNQKRKIAMRKAMLLVLRQHGGQSFGRRPMII